MKRIVSTILAASMLLIGTQAFAQISVGGGYLNTTLASSGANSQSGVGAFVGASYNIPISGALAIAPGVYYSWVTQELSSDFIIGTTNRVINEHAINVPVLINYGIPVGNTAKFYVFAGPTLQYGLSSTASDTVTSIFSDKTSTTTTNNYDKNIYNRTNVYVGGGVGFQVSNFLFTVGYDYGLTDLDAAGNYDNPLNRSNLKIGVSYCL